jgi:cell wall-associated NlpC family hydrolase
MTKEKPMKYLNPWWFDKNEPQLDIRCRKGDRTVQQGMVLNLAVLALFFVTTACATARHDQSNHLPRGSSDRVEEQLRAEAEQWRAVRHRLGGTGCDGIDCSGFVMIIYDKLFGIQLPRTTQKLAHIGSLVPKSKLQPGDLVFFMPTRNKGHVGIYLNNGEFVHASTRKGVTISHMDSPYWRNAYWLSRRVLPAGN